MLAALQLPAQSSGNGSDPAGDALSWMVGEVATMLIGELGGDRGAVALKIGPITYDGRPAVLGDYVAASLPIRLSTRKGHLITVAPRGGWDVVLSGQIFPVGSSLQVFFSLTDAAGNIITGKELRIPVSDSIKDMLNPSRTATAAGDYYEPDSFASPIAVQPGETVEDRTLSPEGDRDWFSFTLPENAEPAVLTVATESSMDTYIEVYSPDDPNYAIIENDDADDEDARIFADIQPGETLIVLVRGYGDDVSGEYRLVSNIEEFEQDNMEPNNRMEVSTVLSLSPIPLSAKIYPSGDVDWYSITIPQGTGEGQFLDVLAGGNLDSYMDLYSADGELLLSDDDGSGDIQARIFYGPVAAGETYFIQLKEYEDSGIGEYTITASLSEPVLDLLEPDGSWEEATEIFPVTDIQVQEHTFTGPGDADWVSFSLDSAATVLLETEGPADTLIRLYDGSHNVLEESDDDGDEYNGRIRRYAAPGTYWLEITQFEESVQAGVEYRLIYGIE